MKNIFFFGDSLTLGVNDTEAPGGWVSRVQLKATAQGWLQGPPAMADTVYNMGVRRHSTEDVEARWQREVETRMLVGGEPYLVFCVGVVDMAAPQGKVNVSVPEALGHSRTMLVGAKAMTPSVLVLSAPPVVNPEHCARIGQWNSQLSALCATLRVPFVDIYAEMLASPTYMKSMGDGLHPGPAGCACFADALLAAPKVQAFITGPASDA